ncbi:hypothetical protein M527_27185 [Sphingobium indicum IP26]|nr:hypothetical protein M527_27185 [Sphingobium indicum IP26]
MICEGEDLQSHARQRLWKLATKRGDKACSQAAALAERRMTFIDQHATASLKASGAMNLPLPDPRLSQSACALSFSAR